MDSSQHAEPFNPEVLFETWAPAESIWSAWAKPVLFAHLTNVDDFGRLPNSVRESEVEWLSQASGDQALIVELPGALSVHFGLAAMAYGYRPVPLFNTSPGPSPVVNVGHIMTALCDAAPVLEKTGLPPAAPPAFLLDSERLAPKINRRPGMFDNRWIAFPQDFPSAEYLQSQGIRQVVIVRADSGKIADDLQDILAPWAKAGLAIAVKQIEQADAPVPVNLPFGRRWRLIRLLNNWGLALRSNSAGGFGSALPQPSEGGTSHFG